MFRIEPADYGLKLTLGGLMTAQEMTDWLHEFSSAVDAIDGTFLVFVDMRTLVPLRHDAQETVIRGQKYARENGMARSVVILSNPVTTAQFRRIAGESGIHPYERYVDASTTPNWEEVGLDWIIEQVDPETRKVEQPH